MSRLLPLLALLLVLAVPGWARADALCDSTFKVGLVPLTSLGAGTWEGMVGGLYGDAGVLRMPTAHRIAGLRAARRIVPRDTDGNVDMADGVMVKATCGHSWNGHYFGLAYGESLAIETGLIDSLIHINASKGGSTAWEWAGNGSAPEDTMWAHFRYKVVTQAGRSHKQVQMLDVTLADYPAAECSQAYVDSCAANILAFVVMAKDSCENLQIIRFYPHGYQGYADGTPIPEPCAYASGFAIRKAINDHMENPVADVWIGWGAYTWANGTTPNRDGLTYQCEDLEVTDGVHLSADVGRPKLVSYILDAGRTDAIARRSLYVRTPEELLCADCF